LGSWKQADNNKLNPTTKPMIPMKHHSYFVAAISALLLPLSLSAGEGNLIPSGDFESVADISAWAVTNNAVPETSEYAEGSQSLRITAYGWLHSPELIEIDPSATYRLRAMIKLPEGYLEPNEGTRTTFALGFEKYDAEGRQIRHHSVVPIADTETELLEAVSLGDTTVRVAGGWDRIDYGGFEYDGIAFGAEPDLSDIPNPHSYLIKSIESGDGFTEITLARPLEEDHPAGTIVRQHGHSDIVSQRAEATNEWTEMILEVSGVSLPGDISREQFWPGTHGVRAAFVAHSDDPDRRVELLVDDVTLTKH